MDEHNIPTTTEDLINTLLSEGLGEGLPKVAEIILNAATDHPCKVNAVPLPSNPLVPNEGFGLAYSWHCRTLAKRRELELELPVARQSPAKPKSIFCGNDLI